MNRRMIEHGESRLPRSEERWVLIKLFRLLPLVMIIAACNGPSTPPPSGTRSATNVAVASEFQEFYEQCGGAVVFGFPISSLYTDPASGRLMQYFQQLRLEYDQSSGQVTPSPLGVVFAPPVEEQQLAANTQNGEERTFSNSSFTIRGEFLTFYDANCGEQAFGLPITPQLDEGGRIVQYFQNALLRWNPNSPPEFRVEVSNLAQNHYLQFGELLDDSFIPTNLATVTEANVRAVVKEPILYAGEEQILYVIVITPDTLNFVPNATIGVTVSYNDISTEMTFLNRTDTFGQAQSALALPGVNPGDAVTVEVRAIGVNNVILGSTMLSFRTWW